MRQTTTALAVALLTVLGGGTENDPCQDLTPRELVLLVDETGGTLLGEVHTQLRVWSDGHATIARSSDFDGWAGMDSAHVPQAQLDQLRADLLAAGAGGLWPNFALRQASRPAARASWAERSSRGAPGNSGS